ncbi:MAG: nuclear transport factor 2 family protein [Planctomycetia bacterium]
MLCRRVISIAVFMAASLASVAGADEDRDAADEVAIRKAIDAYVAAFNKADAKSLAAMWAQEAVYTNPLTDEEVVGREAIEGQFASIFAEAKGVQLESTTLSIGFVSPNVAIEQGIARVIRPDKTSEESQYSAVYVKRDGQWLLDRVTEEVVPVVASNYEQLRELEWMVGRWVDQDDKATVVTECNWTRNNNFLVRSFLVHVNDRINMSGMQIIGWDPAAKQIRSWVFDSDGGFGQATWKKKEDKWFIQQNGILPDGRKSASVNIIRFVDEKTCMIQSVSRTVDDELLPDIAEVRIVKD